MPSSDSKTSFARMREKVLSQSGKQYWRSIEEFVDAPEFEDFVKSEYPAHAETWDNSLSRRNFVKVMGASLALAGLSGCVIQPAEKIVPYVRQPEDMIPGKPLFFATAMSLGGIATGLLAKSYDGRPIKVEGNPSHPGSVGATDIYAQASILEMYDPDRSQEITYRGNSRSWQDFSKVVRAALEENSKDGGAGIRFLTETISSPTLADQFKRLSAELPNSKVVQFDPINNDNVMEGSKLAFGSPVNTVYDLTKAERVLTLDADIFSGFNVRYISDFAKARTLSEDKKGINRLYAVETTTTLAGAKADHRLAIKPSQVPEFAKALAAALGVAGVTSSYTDNAAWIAAAAQDLQEHKGKAVVLAGDNQPPVVHALAHLINGALGAVGSTVTYTEPLFAYEKSQTEQLKELIGEIDAGQVKLLVILGGNPVYNTPADLRLSPERLNKVGLRLHLGTHMDETAAHCHWHVSAKHFLESWSDGRAFDGTASIVQPLIIPIYDGKNAHEVVQLFFKENFDKKDYDVVKGFWQTQNITFPKAAAVPAASETTAVPKAEAETPKANAEAAKTTTGEAKPTAAETKPAVAAPAPGATTAVPAATPDAAASFEDNWRRAVHDGVIPGTALPAKAVTASAAFLAQPQAKPAPAGPLEISILPDPCVYDGRFVNNGWLQELPNPLNKVTWENVALISPATATKLGINTSIDREEIGGGQRGVSFINTRGNNTSADLVTLKYQDASIQKPVPMWVSPGQPDDVITIFMGYGRTRAGKVGTGLGYNAFDVRRSDAMYFGTGDIVKTNEEATVASTQIHFNLMGRDLLRFFDADVFEADPTIGHQENEYDKTMLNTYTGTDMYQKEYAKNHKWAMTIDLNACVGCNACVVACQSENNIPVVGKEQVERNREMHWMRVDTYYSGNSIDAPGGAHFQPVLCQQCEQAPCEVVCPVTATVHSAEGLNDMVYNRCVGTRYCSNNCPYKVRRFNFMLYQDWDTPQYKLMRNPEVTIRSRGVMEKCTYCTQRIADARIEAEKDGRAIRDGEVLTACQAVCPASAIVFGNLNDTSSRVYASKKDHRNYTLLNELNTQPRTTYLAGLKNQNTKMPDYKALAVPKKHGEEKGEGKKTEGGEAH